MHCIKCFLIKYEEYCINFGKQEQMNPHIAVVCSRNSSIRTDVELIIKFLKEKRLHVYMLIPEILSMMVKCLSLMERKFILFIEII